MATPTNSFSCPPRLRTIHPLREPDGSCRLLYDLERTLILEVPAEFQQHVAQDIDTGAWGPELGVWLASEDLLTFSHAVSWAQGAPAKPPKVSDVSLDMSGACNMGCAYCFENDIDSRIGRMSDQTAFAALDFVFDKTRGVPRIALHFGSGEPLMRFDLLCRIVPEAVRRAQVSGQQISFELTSNATLVTPKIARFLRDHPFNVRVSCDGPPHLHNPLRPLLGGQDSYPAVERGLKLLLEFLPERLTVNSVLSGGIRLQELWNWAKHLGLRHYHVIKVGAYAENNLNLRETELREFRDDLQPICDDLFAELEAGRVPIDYQPITKIVRRLMIPEPITRFCGVAGTYLGVASNGKVYPCFRHLGLKLYELGDVSNGVDDDRRRNFLGREATDVDTRPVCRECWARYLCGGGCYADSVVYGPDKRKPQVQHCPFWRAEIDQAIRFFRRLVDTDPSYCLRLFGDDPDEVIASLDGEAGFMRRKNCL